MIDSRLAGLVVPTKNAGKKFSKFITYLMRQTFLPSKIIIIDSGSSDETVMLARREGLEVVEISPADFDHGKTRQIGVDLLKKDFVFFLTQDSFLADEKSLENLIKPLVLDSEIGAAYGRQVPRKNAVPIEFHARVFNYPNKSSVNSLQDIPRLGIKTAFISNSFAVYRKAALDRVGGFPQKVLFSEDLYVGAKLILAGWKLAYVADAAVFHSHKLSLMEEFVRYFNIGCFHRFEPWIFKKFGNPEGEGLRFFISELCFVSKFGFSQIIECLFRNFLKLSGFKIGFYSSFLPIFLCAKISKNQKWWKNLSQYSACFPALSREGLKDKRYP